MKSYKLVSTKERQLVEVRCDFCNRVKTEEDGWDISPAKTVTEGYDCCTECFESKILSQVLKRWGQNE